MGWSWNPIDDVEQVAHDVKEGVENTAHAAGDVVSGVAHAARDEVGGVARGAGDVVSGVAQGISDEVGGLVDGAGDLLSGHPLDAVEDVAGGVVRGAGDVVGGVARGAGDVVEGVAHGISDEIGGLVHGVEDLFGGDQTVAEKEAGDVKKEQGDLRKMLADDGDFSTSDEILDAGTVGLRFFADFIPVYKQAAQYVAGVKNVNIDLSADIYHNYDETRGIDMGRFRGDAEHIDSAVKQISTSQQNLSSSFGSLSDWTGSGADAARRYNDSLLGAMAGFVTGKSESSDGAPALGQVFAAGAQSAPQVITTAMSNIQAALKGQAQNIGGMYSTQCGGQTVEQVRDNIRKASGDLSIGDIGGGDILSGIGESVKDAFLGGLLGGGIGGLIGGLIGAGESGEKARENIINQAKQRLQAFVAEFDSKKIAFDQHIHTVQQAILQDYHTMLDGLKSLQQDPAKGIADPPSFEATDHRSSRNGPGDHRSGDGGGTGGGSNSGGSGGGTVPVGGSTMPSGSTPPAAAPSVSAPTGNSGHPETVTIHDGDSTIQLSSSDSRGHVKLTVDNGTGKPKTYDIDFGEGAGGTGGRGLSGLGGTRGDASETKGIDNTETVDANGVHHVHAGPDGMATIHDGKETITVQQPDGNSGDVKLTVDDGTGKPKAYDVDFTGAAHSVPSSASSLGAGPEVSLPGAVTAPETGTAGAGGGGGAGGFASAASAGAGSTQLGDGGMTGASDSAVHQEAPAGPAAASAPAAGRNSTGGMPMMGGMAGMGAGSGAGGDTERGSNPLLRGSGKVFKPDPDAERAAKIRRVLEGGN